MIPQKNYSCRIITIIIELMSLGNKLEVLPLLIVFASYPILKIVKMSFFFRVILLIFMLIIMGNTYGQNFESRIQKSYGLVFGYQGFKQNIIELGIVRGFQGNILVSGVNERLFSKIQRPYSALFCSYSFDPALDIKGLSFGFTGSAGGIIGLDINYHRYSSDFWGLRFSGGLSILGVETLFRYNIKLAGEKIPGVAGPSFSIRYYLPIIIYSSSGYRFKLQRKLNN